MKGPDYKMNTELEKCVHDCICNVWDKLSGAAASRNTSIGAVASECGLSASAIYQAMRRCYSSDLNYTDTALSIVVTLAKQLKVDVDALFQMGKHEEETPGIVDRLCPLIEDMTEAQLENIKKELVNRIQGSNPA